GAARRVSARSGAGLASAHILPERVVGASLLEQFSTQAVSADSINAHRRALAGESVSYQIKLGDRRYDADVERLRDEVGAIVGAVGVAVDGSDRAQAPAEQPSGRLDLEDFFEHATVGLSWLGQDGTILRANAAELDLVGLARDQYVGRNVRQFHVDPAIADDILRRLRAGETVLNVAARLRHRDGSIRHVLVSTNALLEGGRFLHDRCVTRDVTALKRPDADPRHSQPHTRSATSPPARPGPAVLPRPSPAAPRPGAPQPHIGAERRRRGGLEAGPRHCGRRFGCATGPDKGAQLPPRVGP